MARATRIISDDEALPEADRLEAFPHPRFTRELFGHTEAEVRLAQGLASGQLHHAWLLSGPQGIGKATLAYKFAQAALARPVDRLLAGGRLAARADTPSSHQVRALSHPGLLVIRRPYDIKAKRFSASIPVEEVRRLRSFLSLSAGDATWRVVIVDSAGELNTNAANALLKSLEEPPARTVFLLISSETARLLPTIRSRCTLLPLQPLLHADLKNAVAQAVSAKDGAETQQTIPEELLSLSGGRVRQALSLMSGGGLELQKQIISVFENLPQFDWRAAHALADELQPAAAEQKFELFFELFLAELARRIRSKATVSVAEFGTQPWFTEAKLATFAALWERVARDKVQALSLNLDRKSLILEALLGLEAAARE